MAREGIGRRIESVSPTLRRVSAVPARLIPEPDVILVRTDPELELEFGRLQAAMEVLFVKVATQADDAPWTPDERHRVGVYAAALWTIGRTGEVPMGGTESSVTDRAIRDQLARAQDLMVSRREGWEFGLGVVQWLLWVTGGSEKAPTYFR